MRQVVPLIQGIDAVAILALAERIADDDPEIDWDSDWLVAWERVNEHSVQAATRRDQNLAGFLITTLSEDVHEEAYWALEYLSEWQGELFIQDKPVLLTEFVRCIFGNPFRPVTVNPEWLTSTVVALAQGIYDDRAFDRLPILADALQDAGCDNVEMLNHCRDAGPHARGCWVVDLVLGKV